MRLQQGTSATVSLHEYGTVRDLTGQELVYIIEQLERTLEPNGGLQTLWVRHGDGLYFTGESSPTFCGRSA